MSGCLQMVEVPGAEGIDQVFRVRGVGSGQVSGTADPLVGTCDETAVLIVRRLPHCSQVANVVVRAFLRILVHEPAGAQQRPPCGEGQNRETYDMVAHEVVPGIGLGPERQSAKIALREAAEKLTAGDLGIKRLRLAALIKGQTHGSEACSRLEPLDLDRRQAACFPAGVFGLHKISEFLDL